MEEKAKEEKKVDILYENVYYVSKELNFGKKY